MEFQEVVHKVDPKGGYKSNFHSRCGLPMDESIPDEHCWSSAWHDVTCPYCKEGKPFQDEESLNELLGDNASGIVKGIKMSVNMPFKGGAVPEWEEDPEIKKAEKIAQNHIEPITLQGSLASLITADEANDLYEELHGEKERQAQEQSKIYIVKTVDSVIRKGIQDQNRIVRAGLSHKKKPYEKYLKDFYDFFIEVLTDKGYGVTLSHSHDHADYVRVSIIIRLEDEE